MLPADRLAAIEDTPENPAWFVLIGITITGVWYSELVDRFPGIMRALEQRGEAWVRLSTLRKLAKYHPLYSDGASRFPASMKNPRRLHY